MNSQVLPGPSDSVDLGSVDGCQESLFLIGFSSDLGVQPDLGSVLVPPNCSLYFVPSSCIVNF